MVVYSGEILYISFNKSEKKKKILYIIKKVSKVKN